MSESDTSAVSSEDTLAWEALRAAVWLTRRSPPEVETAFLLDERGALRPAKTGRVATVLNWHPARGWSTGPAATQALRSLAPLYLPLAVPGVAQPLTVGHLGQSLDGFVATLAGDSCYVTGRENILHLHRMRALSDAVLVGAGTVSADDPRLTTRLVRGENPRRVVLDPYARLSPSHRVFTDGEAETLVVRAADAADAGGRRFARAEVLAVPARERRLDLPYLLAELARRGVERLFIEGGGATVSAFLHAGLLHRLQVAVAPVVIGEGRPGIRLPPRARLQDCLRPDCRSFPMGEDVFFDCILHDPHQPLVPAGGAQRPGD